MAVQVDALNYPYIRVRDLEWLKQTLLIFPHVARMTPAVRAPAEDPEISAFTSLANKKDRYPLLRVANLYSANVHDAQSELILELRSRLENDRKGFRSRYGKKAAKRLSASLIGKNLTTWERRASPHGTFQIHAYKLYDELVSFLSDEKLAWKPNSAIADGPDYLEMHPHLGEAVMATLAVACAEDEGMQVVTEFPKLHGKLIGTPRHKILTACLDRSKPTGETSARMIAEFFVHRRCNVAMVSAKNILALQEERAALASFRTKLEELAKTLPPIIRSEEHLEERLNDTLDDMFKEWETEQANLGSASKRFFGEGFGSELKKIAEKLAEAAMKPETVTGGLVGGISGHALTGIGAGFAIAVVFRGFESWGKAWSQAKTSPLRYLTKLQEHGVNFRLTGTSDADDGGPLLDAPMES
jgi:hypothetical protein